MAVGGIGVFEGMTVGVTGAAVGGIGVFEGLTVGVTGVAVSVAGVARWDTVQPLLSVTVSPKVAADTPIGLSLR